MATGEEISVRQWKQPGFVCFIRVFEDSWVRSGSAKGGRGADILTTMRDLHTSPRNVWICLGDIHTSLVNVIIFECDCTESYQPTDHQSLLFSRVSTQVQLSYYPLLRAAWVGNALSFISWLPVEVIWNRILTLKIHCGFWGRKARKVRSRLMYYWRWSLQNHICLPSYRNSNQVITAHKHDSYWLEGDYFSTQQPNGVLA